MKKIIAHIKWVWENREIEVSNLFLQLHTFTNYSYDFYNFAILLMTHLFWREIFEHRIWVNFWRFCEQK